MKHGMVGLLIIRMITLVADTWLFRHMVGMTLTNPTFHDTLSHDAAKEGDAHC